MMHANKLSITDITSQMRELNDQQQTGVAFIVTESKVIAQIVFANGNIVNSRYLRLRGVEAIKEIFKSKMFSEFRFVAKQMSGIKIHSGTQFPPFGAILRMIQASNDYRRPTPSHPRTPRPKQRPAPVAAVASQPAAFGRQNTNRLVSPTVVIQLVSQEFVRHVGPMAQIICKQVLENVNSVEAAFDGVDVLAREIDNTQARQAFSAAAKAQIRRRYFV